MLSCVYNYPCHFCLSIVSYLFNFRTTLSESTITYLLHLNFQFFYATISLSRSNLSCWNQPHFLIANVWLMWFHIVPLLSLQWLTIIAMPIWCWFSMQVSSSSTWTILMPFPFLYLHWSQHLKRYSISSGDVFPVYVKLSRKGLQQSQFRRTISTI